MSQDNEMHSKIPSVTGIALILGSIIAITGFMLQQTLGLNPDDAATWLQSLGSNQDEATMGALLVTIGLLGWVVGVAGINSALQDTPGKVWASPGFLLICFAVISWAIIGQALVLTEIEYGAKLTGTAMDQQLVMAGGVAHSANVAITVLGSVSFGAGMILIGLALFHNHYSHEWLTYLAILVGLVAIIASLIIYPINAEISQLITGFCFGGTVAWSVGMGIYRLR